MLSRVFCSRISCGCRVYTTKAGELANARKMSDEGIYDFFSKVAKGG